MSETEERFSRLLNMVPYVLGHSGVTVQEVCSRFEISRSQLISDLNLLFVCGLPGYGPGDLIEAYVDGDRVSIRMADYVSRPLRLTPAEGLLLYSGAKAMGAAGVSSDEGSALRRATERLTEVLGSDALERVSVAVDAPPELEQVRRALQSRRRIHVTYQSHSKDELTERDVDPWAVFFSSGRWYLVGWCHRVNDERIFRLDRMREVRILDETCEVPADVDLTRYESIYVKGPGAIHVVVDLAPEAGWVLEYYPVESSEPLENGWQRVALSAGGTAWLERLLLRLGRHARVVEPESLGRSVRDLACRLVERYKH